MNIQIIGGVDFDLTLIWRDHEGNPIDVRFCNAYMHIRQTHESEVLFDATRFLITAHEEGRNGEVRLYIPAAETLQIPSFKFGVFDIIIKTDDHKVYPLASGVAHAKKSITRLA